MYKMMSNEIYFDNEDAEDIPKDVRRRKKALYKAIKERMEFYFSDANLQKDRFLSKLLENDPQVDLSIFLRFNRIQQLTNSLKDLTKALKTSEILRLSEDKTKVFRLTPVVVKENEDACTIYVEQLPPDADHDWLYKIFSRYGKVDYVSIPKYKRSGKIKGFAFVEFEKPEHAQKALEEFEKEGCCLASHMNPEQLCSIATFEEDKADGKESASQPIEDGNTKPVKLEENEKRGKKRKNTKTETEEEEVEVKEKKVKKEMDDEEENQNNEESKVDSSTEDENVNSSNINENPVGDNEIAEESDQVPTKKKKNRKKKKSHKTKYVFDIKACGLHILSKTDWKKLRNKYLNLQKEKMKRLKQQLYRSQLSHSQRQQQMAEQQQQLPSSNSKPRFEFKSGLIIKIAFDEPLKDNSQVSQFKSDAKSIENVEYVDVSLGSTEGYIRFRDGNTVQEIMQSKPWENMYLLEGEEEQDYWEKMKKDRVEKFGNQKKFNKRGRNKFMNRAEKLIGKRIRLSVDE